MGRSRRKGEFPLVGDIAGHQQYPSVALHRAGGLVAWQNATAESGGERVVVQALGTDYRGMGAPRVVSQNITGQNDLNPAVAALPEGNRWWFGNRARVLRGIFSFVFWMPKGSFNRIFNRSIRFKPACNPMQPWQH